GAQRISMAATVRNRVAKPTDRHDSEAGTAERETERIEVHYHTRVSFPAILLFAPAKARSPRRIPPEAPRIAPALSTLLLRVRGKLDHRHRAPRYLRHLPVPPLRHLVLHQRHRDAPRQELVRFRLRLGFRHDRLGTAGCLDRVTLRLELILLQLVLR